MTREETLQAIKVMQAFADGKTIEEYDHYDCFWAVTKNPVWNWENYSYRIVPGQEEPKEKFADVLNCLSEDEKNDIQQLILDGKRDDAKELLMGYDNNISEQRAVEIIDYIKENNPLNKR